MSVMLRADTLRDIQKMAAVKKTQIENKIRKIDELGDRATPQQKSYQRTLKLVLTPS